MNRLLVGIMLLAIVCIAGSCTDEDEYTQGQWMKKASYKMVLMSTEQVSAYTL